jgi:gluconolactonase
VEKISLAQAAAVSDKRDAVGLVNITTVPALPIVLNPNGKQLPCFVSAGYN